MLVMETSGTRLLVGEPTYAVEGEIAERESAELSEDDVNWKGGGGVGGRVGKASIISPGSRSPE